MALPQGPFARSFYRCALERLEDAEILFNEERTTGSVYLAGYAVECMLKALLLSQLPLDEHEEMVGTFRGNRAHDFEWIRDEYLASGGASLPNPITVALDNLEEWSTGLRYEPATLDDSFAEDFLKSTRLILQWADGRM